MDGDGHGDIRLGGTGGGRSRCINIGESNGEPLVYKINRGSYMSAQVLLNLLNELGKREKWEFNKFNNTRA